MFNNPFDSFQDTITEGKEEREQLDRLLTISTPRERLLVAVIGGLLCILAAWLILGNVARTIAVDGALAGPGASQSETTLAVQALVWIESDVAREIKPGMPVAIALGRAGERAEALGGKIRAISSLPLSERLAAFESAAPVSVYRLDIALDESRDFAFLAGRQCRIVIELGRQSPVALFGMRRS